MERAIGRNGIQGVVAISAMRQNGELNRGGFLAIVSFFPAFVTSGSKDDTEIHAK